jgi:hypothetical protein
MLHSKGASYDINNFNIVKREYFDAFISNRKNIEEKFKDESIGLWSLYGRFNYNKVPYVTWEQHNEYFDLTKYITPNKFPYKNIGYEALMTFYAIKFNIVQRFFNECHNDDLFEKNIETELGHNRYFFEHIFPKIVERYGYIPYVNIFWDADGMPYSKEKLDELICVWKKNGNAV